MRGMGSVVEAWEIRGEDEEGGRRVEKIEEEEDE
jgi:hypothetical protein